VSALYFATRSNLEGNIAMRASMVATFVFLASFSLFNVALGRTWRWPGLLFAASFGMLFVSRIAFGG